MSKRFAYLEGQRVRSKKRDKSKPDPDSLEPLEIVYVRKEVLRAVWREVKREGGESVSELVDELLSAWLRTRSGGHAE